MDPSTQHEKNPIGCRNGSVERVRPVLGAGIHWLPQMVLCLSGFGRVGCWDPLATSKWSVPERVRPCWVLESIGYRKWFCTLRLNWIRAAYSLPAAMASAWSFLERELRQAFSS